MNERDKYETKDLQEEKKQHEEEELLVQALVVVVAYYFPNGRLHRFDSETDSIGSSSDK